MALALDSRVIALRRLGRAGWDATWTSPRPVTALAVHRAAPDVYRLAVGSALGVAVLEVTPAGWQRLARHPARTGAITGLHFPASALVLACDALGGWAALSLPAAPAMPDAVAAVVASVSVGGTATAMAPTADGSGGVVLFTADGALERLMPVPPAAAAALQALGVVLARRVALAHGGRADPLLADLARAGPVRRVLDTRPLLAFAAAPAATQDEVGAVWLAAVRGETGSPSAGPG